MLAEDMECEGSLAGEYETPHEDLCSTPGWSTSRKLTATAAPPSRYNLLVPDVKPFRLTEFVKAAG